MGPSSPPALTTLPTTTPLPCFISSFHRSSPHQGHQPAIGSSTLPTSPPPYPPTHPTLLRPFNLRGGNVTQRRTHPCSPRLANPHPSSRMEECRPSASHPPSGFCDPLPACARMTVAGKGGRGKRGSVLHRPTNPARREDEAGRPPWAPSRPNIARDAALGRAPQPPCTQPPAPVRRISDTRATEYTVLRMHDTSRGSPSAAVRSSQI